MKVFDEIPYLENDRLILKKVTEDGASCISELMTNKEVQKFLPTFLFEYGFDDPNEVIKNLYGDIFKNKESLFLGIYVKENPDDVSAADSQVDNTEVEKNCGENSSSQKSSMAGLLEIYNYVPNWNKVSIGCRLTQKFWGKGIAKDSIVLAMDYLLNETDVKRITAHVMIENSHSYHVVESLGYDLRKYEAEEDWGFGEPAIVNKYVYEKWGNISYQKIGNGEKIMVILPGLALQSTLGASEAIAKNFAKFTDYTIYLFDDRSNVKPGYTLRERAGDVAAEMHNLHLKNAYVYGASMGGMVAQYLAIDHPDLVKKLFLSSTCSKLTPYTEEVVKRWGSLARKGKLGNLLDDSLSLIYSDKVVEKYGKFFKGSVGNLTEEELEKFAILTDAVQQLNTYDELEKITCPACVVVAMGDRVITPQGPIRLAEKLGCTEDLGNSSEKQTRKLIIYGKEFGHAVYDEARDHNQKILDFFNS